MFETQSSELAELISPLSETVDARQSSIRLDLSQGLEMMLFDDLELLVVSWRGAGFEPGQIEILRDVIRDIASGHIGPCKFLVFDIGSGDGCAVPPDNFADFTDELSNLTFQVPVLSIAWARGILSGAALEMALTCSMTVGEEGARVAFTMDLVDSLRAYSLLAHKVGFVRAERLMEDGSVLSAAAAHEMMLLHAVVSPERGLDGVRRFARSRLRRHNSACGLYRAQRIAMAGVPRVRGELAFQ